MRILIAGAGIAGLATAVTLSESGHEVTVLERASEDNPLGSGITLIAPAIRALKQLDVLDECVANGYKVTQFIEHTWQGEQVRTVDLPSATGPGGPGILGMMRPTLHDVLSRRAQEAGATIEWGREVISVNDDGERVTVGFPDGSSLEAELLIGADGLRSSVRRLVFGEFPVVFQNQGCFRAVLPRPADMGQEIDFGGYPGIHPGFTPLNDELMYMYCTTEAKDASHIADEDLPVRLRELLEPFGGLVARVREQITDPALINYRPFETILVPEPWHKGRVLLLGDAVHSTTPHLAAGGAMCLEDALVIAEELTSSSELGGALESFTARRYPRAKFVVETSVTLAGWQLNVDDPERDPSGLKMKARTLLAGAY